MYHDFIKLIKSVQVRLAGEVVLKNLYFYEEIYDDLIPRKIVEFSLKNDRFPLKWGLPTNKAFLDFIEGSGSIEALNVYNAVCVIPFLAFRSSVEHERPNYLIRIVKNFITENDDLKDIYQIYLDAIGKTHWVIPKTRKCYKLAKRMIYERKFYLKFDLALELKKAGCQFQEIIDHLNDDEILSTDWVLWNLVDAKRPLWKKILGIR